MNNNPSLEQLELSAKALLTLITKIKSSNSAETVDKDLLLNETRNFYKLLLFWEPENQENNNETFEEEHIIEHEITEPVEKTDSYNPKTTEVSSTKEKNEPSIEEKRPEPPPETEPEISETEENNKDVHAHKTTELHKDKNVVGTEKQGVSSEENLQESRQEEQISPKENTSMQEPKTTLDLFSDMTGDSLGTTYERAKKPMVGETVKNPVKDLREAIGINDKFLFINELFHGDMSKYNKVLDELNEFSNLSGTLTYLSELSVQYNWTKKDMAYLRFEEILQKKFK